MAIKNLEGYLGSLKDEVVDLKNPNCKNCNECCTITASVSKTELKAMKRYITRHKDIKKLINKNIEGMVGLGASMYCPFSDRETKKCLVYKVRPEVCKEFHCSKEKTEKFKRIVRSNKFIIGDLFGISMKDIGTYLATGKRKKI